MYEYLVPSWERFQPDYEKQEVALRPYPSIYSTGNRLPEPLIDRSPKLYIDGKQTRSDSGYSFTVEDPTGTIFRRPDWVIAKTSEMPSRRRPKQEVGLAPLRTCAGRFFIISQKISRFEQPNFRIDSLR